MRCRHLLPPTLLLMLACGGPPPDPDGPPPTPEAPTPATPSASAADPTGVWAEPVDIAMVGYDDAAACTADEGQWEPDLGCVFSSENTATFTPSGDAWTLNVSIIGANAHTCEFEGTARRDGDGLIATAPAERYVPGTDGAEGRFEPATCTIQIRIQGDALSLEGDYETCSSFCGARAFLSMSEARRR